MKEETAIFIAHDDHVHRDIAESEKNLMRAILRTAMDDRVRREIANRGLAQSQIVVLDALLREWHRLAASDDRCHPRVSSSRATPLLPLGLQRNLEPL